MENKQSGDIWPGRYQKPMGCRHAEHDPELSLECRTSAAIW